jgi:hypothetical protein
MPFSIGTLSVRMGFQLFLNMENIVCGVSGYGNGNNETLAAELEWRDYLVWKRENTKV